MSRAFNVILFGYYVRRARAVTSENILVKDFEVHLFQCIVCSSSFRALFYSRRLDQASKTSCWEARFAPGLTMRGLKFASTSDAGQSRDRHGQAVEEKDTNLDTNLKCTDDSEHLCLNRHTSDPGYFQRAQSASISWYFARNDA
jgi:hypothetical protein